MQVNALTKQQKIEQLNRKLQYGKITFQEYHNALLPLYEK